MKCKLSLLGSLFTAVAALAADFPPLTLPEGVGVNIHFTRGRERDLDLIAGAGFKFIRMDFGWGGTERKKGEYNWADYDELTANLEKRGLRAIYIFDYSNGLYEDAIVSKDPVSGKERRDTASPQKPESVAAFARWAAAAARHYQGRRVVWEIWNEPNISFWKPKPDVKQYTAVVQATLKAVREADPRATIVAPASSGFPWEFFESLFAAPGVLENLDGVSVHPYRSYSQGPETAVKEYTRLRSLIERHAPAQKKFIPILSGEWGYASHTKGVSLETQAAFIARQQLANLLRGVPVSIWYDWKNDGLDPQYNEHHFGTVSNNLAFKPAYVAVQTLTRELSGFRIARQLDTGSAEDFVLLLVNQAGDQKLAAWTTGSPHLARLGDGLKAADASAVDGQGHPLALTDEAGALALNLQSAPQYLTIKKPVRAWTGAAAWSLAQPVPTLVEAGVPGGVPVAVQVKNPFAEPARVKLELRWPQGADQAEFDLASGQTLLRQLAFNPVRRGPLEMPATLSLEYREENGRTISSSSQALRFVLSNPLNLVLAPVDGGLRLLIENPSRSPFDGLAMVGESRLPVRLDGSASELALAVAGKVASSPVAVQLINGQGRAVTDTLTNRFLPLAPLVLKAHLDGDAKIPAQATLVETNAPGGREAPFARAWRLDYQFEAGWRFARCAPAGAKPGSFPGKTRALGLWVYGDGSGNALRARVTDATGQTFQPGAPNLDWKGWRWVTFDLADLKHAGHWGGANDGVVHGELRLDSALLVDGSSRKTSGAIYFAGLTLVE